MDRWAAERRAEMAGVRWTGGQPSAGVACLQESEAHRRRGDASAGDERGGVRFDGGVGREHERKQLSAAVGVQQRALGLRMKKDGRMRQRWVIEKKTGA